MREARSMRAAQRFSFFSSKKTVKTFGVLKVFTTFAAAIRRLIANDG